MIHEELIGGTYCDITTYEAFAYAASHAGVEVYNISRSDSIHLIRHIYLPGAYSVVIADTLLIVSAGDATMNICTITTFNISNPGDPELLGELSFDHYIDVPKVRDHYLYLAYRGHGVSVVSIENPRQPELIATVGQPAVWLWHVHIYEDYLYATEGNRGTRLFVYSLEDPEMPDYLRSIDTGGEDRGSLLWGRDIYLQQLYRGSGRLLTISLEEPDNPEIVDVFNSNLLSGKNPTIISDRLWMLGWDPLIFSLENPEEPEFLGSARELGYPGDNYYTCAGETAGDTTYLVMFDHPGVEAWNLTNQDTLFQYGEVHTNRGAEYLAFNDDYIYAAKKNWLFTIRFTPPVNTEIVDSLDAGHYLGDMVYHNGFIYSTGGSSTTILDCRDAEHPVRYGALRDTTDDRTYWNKSALLDDVLILASGHGLFAYSLARPGHPELISVLYGDYYYFEGMQPYQNCIVVNRSDGGFDPYLNVISYDNPSDPEVLGSFGPTSNTGSFGGICGQYFVLSQFTRDAGYRCRVIDLSDPTNLTEASNSDIYESGTKRMGVAGSIVFYNNAARNRLLARHLDEDGILRTVGECEDRSTRYYIHNSSLIGANHHSIKFYSEDALSVRISESGDTAPNEMRIAAFPNPFNATVSISIPNARITSGEIIISDLLGRRVWYSSIDETTFAGNGIFNWKAQSITSTILPSGFYLVNVRSPRGQLTAKVSFIR
ncbi:MAG: T9SS type A sorting domain-containing protein [Candidatus Hatepunaea meridiana]|nr:T9SS type A sorting domain-containing protein [Candidatus Hatepunaea meridiana]